MACRELRDFWNENRIVILEVWHVGTFILNVVILINTFLGGNECQDDIDWIKDNSDSLVNILEQLPLLFLK